MWTSCRLFTPSSLSQDEIACHAYPGESVVTQIIFSGDGLDLGRTPNLRFLVLSKKYIPLPVLNLAESPRNDPSITITYFLVKNRSCTNAT